MTECQSGYEPPVPVPLQCRGARRFVGEPDRGVQRVGTGPPYRLGVPSTGTQDEDPFDGGVLGKVVQGGRRLRPLPVVPVVRCRHPDSWTDNLVSLYAPV